MQAAQRKTFVTQFVTLSVRQRQAGMALAYNLKLRVAAKGVETLAQLDYLHQHCYDEAQSFSFGRPLPARQVEMLLDSVPATAYSQADALCLVAQRHAERY